MRFMSCLLNFSMYEYETTSYNIITSSLFATILGTCVGDSFYKVKWKDALQFTSQDTSNLKLNL